MCYFFFLFIEGKIRSEIYFIYNVAKQKREVTATV